MNTTRMLPLKIECALARLEGMAQAFDTQGLDLPILRETAGELRKILTAQVEALEEAAEYFTNQSDVVDGSYGIPEPNKEMQLASAMREAIYGVGP
ncbi:MAG: hypothetical protein KF810_17020 [Rhizobiaceae bacterium]|nr:hypothetical protein [Rhizobiaceae bacterium]